MVLESYGIVKCHFPGPGKFWIFVEELFQYGYGKVFNFCLGKFYYILKWKIL